MPGQYLTTNYRITGGMTNPISLGGYALIQGSANGGAGMPVSPIVIGSYSGNSPGAALGSNVVSIEAYSVLASYFGCDQMASGYKIFPFFVRPKYRNIAATGQSGSNPIYWGSVSTSAGASQMFFWYGISDQSPASGSVSAGQSFNFVFAGLVVSSP